MAFADATKYGKLKSLSGYPVGTIIPWSGLEETIPTGWRICSGAFLNVTDYPKLYNSIGNTYGGTPGSTFGLPNLPGNGIIDIFVGHYKYLQKTTPTYGPGSSNDNPMDGLPTAPWTPNPTLSRNNDPYWNQVGGANSGNSGSGAGNPTPSTIDLVGVRSNATPGLSAIVSGLALTPGTLQRAYSVLPRKLGDGHIPVHTHSISASGEISHAQTTTTFLYYARTWEYYGCFDNVQRENDAKSTAEFRNTTTGNHFVAGGGSTTTTTELPGSGFSDGDMLAHVGGRKNFHTSINAPIRTWDSTGGHDHGSNTITFTSALSVKATNTYTDIVSSDVIIDNSPGLDAGTINMTSACPSLTMLFIIKAF
jgi:microcystin-dependent protein